MEPESRQTEIQTVSDVASWLERLAPSRLAESWDNVGLLFGDPQAPIDRVMTCLTVTSETAAEALECRANLIVSHHPVFFRGTKRLRADLGDTGYLWNLARAGVAIVSAHTAFDNAVGGINDLLAGRLGLLDIGSIRRIPLEHEWKVVVFAPDNDRERILDAAFQAGAGRIGAYTDCSFSTTGQGTFFGTESTNPSVGRRGRRETVDEWKIEMVCDRERLPAVITAIRLAHSYEEPAIDVLSVADQSTLRTPGVGRVGRLPEPMNLANLATLIRQTWNAENLVFAGDPCQCVSRLAIACGAGDDFLSDARRAGADALLTGEARFHRAFEAKQLGIGLIVAGHHVTERPGVEDLARRIAHDFPTLEVWASRREVDPWQTVGS